METMHKICPILSKKLLGQFDNIDMKHIHIRKYGRRCALCFVVLDLCCCPHSQYYYVAFILHFLVKDIPSRRGRKMLM